MRATLDHVGIAVKDLAAALAFYRDALGLEVEAPEEVASQRVRAHFVPVGESKLELLEATASDSAIAKYVEKRGPGLHHITLRVDDISATLVRLKARGVRLVDEQPRPGAEGALVAFIHPSSAHGVLVELKQSAASDQHVTVGPQPPVANPHRVVLESRVQRFSLGTIELVSLCDGFFHFDGGAMFGAVPKSLWSARAPADERNRITLALRPLVVRGARTMIIDAGFGDKDSEQVHEVYGVDRTRPFERTLAEAGFSVEDIDIVLATHLHTDHAGGFTVRDAAGRLRPRFPRAQYVVRRGEWEVATHPHARNGAMYVADDFVPLAEAGVLQLVDDDQTIMPGVRVRRTGGHTMHHQMVLIESGGRAAAFVAELIPTVAHLPDPWIMGYDLFPLDTLAAKKAFVKEALDRKMLIFFEHDPAIVAGYLTNDNGKRRVVPV
jgi:methylmalonyl-CoA epimerase